MSDNVPGICARAWFRQELA